MLFVEVRHKAIDWVTLRDEREHMHRDIERKVAEWSERVKRTGRVS